MCSSDLRGWGYALELLPGVGRTHRYLAGTDAERRSDLHRAFSGEFDAVWAARGGYGVARLLADLPWRDLAPVPLIGFSDLTVLLNQVAARGAPAIHGPVLHSLSRSDPASQEHLRRLMAGEPVEAFEGIPLVPGDASGALVGGNLCVLASACGTRWQLRTHACILLLEEINEVPYKVDRLITQLYDSGCLDGVAGVALGTFLGCDAPSDADWSIHDVLRDLLEPLGVPVLAHLPVGHGSQNRAFRVGAPARIVGNRLEIG